MTTTQVNVGAVPPQQGAAGTQGEHHPNSTTNVHIYPNGGGAVHAVPLGVPHGHHGNERERPRASYAGPYWFACFLVLAVLLWGMMGWPTIKVGPMGGPLPPATVRAEAPADPSAGPVAPANVVLDPLPAPSYTREVPVHDGSNVLCEVTLAGPEAILGNDEDVMSFVKTNETSLCTSAEGALSWNGESITWKRGS
jgi:hypothetical protein